MPEQYYFWLGYEAYEAICLPHLLEEGGDFLVVEQDQDYE
jgi:hypothetical protein